MTKSELLRFLVQTGEADAHDVAQTFDISYSAASMSLLRLGRQGLVTRRLDPDSGLYWYTLTEQGEGRLAYFRSLENTAS